MFTHGNMRGSSALQRKTNSSGFAQRAMAGVERATGVSLADVNVHYNSGEPGKYGALAFTRGTDVHLAPGQERHLGHELGHVVQQKRGSVPVTMRMGGVGVNDSPALESEADRIGAGSGVVQRREVMQLRGAGGGVLQRKVGMEFQVMETGDIKECNNLKLKNYEEHGTLLKDNGGYRITADGSNFEYVTNAFDERNDNEITGLVNACKNAANAHKDIKTALVIPSTESPMDRIYYRHQRGSNLFIRQSTKMTAHPQATVGIKLDSLDRFMTNYNAVLNRRNRQYNVGRINNLDDLALWYGGSQSSADAGPQGTIANDVANVGGLAGLSHDGQGFVKLLASMARNTNDYKNRKNDPINAKSAMPLMPRTSLIDAFRLLPDNDKQFISLESPALCNIILPGTNSFSNIVIASQQDVGDKTLEDWIDEASVNGNDRDLFSVYNSLCEFNNTTPQKNRKKFGVARSTDIGHDIVTPAVAPATDPVIAPVHGILMELRGLQRKVHCDDWWKVARDVALLTRFSNNIAATGYTSPPQVLQPLPPQNRQGRRSNRFGPQITVPRVPNQRAYP